MGNQDPPVHQQERGDRERGTGAPSGEAELDFGWEWEWEWELGRLGQEIHQGGRQKLQSPILHPSLRAPDSAACT